jgi:hypothetical protein
LILGKTDKLSKKLKKSNPIDEGWLNKFYSRLLGQECQVVFEKLSQTIL